MTEKFNKMYTKLMEEVAMGGGTVDGGSTVGGAMSDATYVDASVNNPSAPNAIYVIVKTDSGATKRFESKEECEEFLKNNQGWKLKED